MSDPLRLTEDEMLCVLAACCQGLANPGELKDDEDRTSAKQLRDATVKIARAVGMDLETLAQFAAYAAGKPASGVVAALVEKEEKGR